MTKTEWLDVTEHARIIRAALKTVWPDLKFQVRSERYAGGSSITVHMPDGYRAPEWFYLRLRDAQGARFDGMTDSQSSVRHVLPDGRAVRLGGDYVSTSGGHGLDNRWLPGSPEQMAQFDKLLPQVKWD